LAGKGAGTPYRRVGHKKALTKTLLLYLQGRIQIWIKGRVKGWGLVPSPPYPFPSLPLPHPSPSPSRPFPLEVGPLNPARVSGERCKLPQRGLDGASAEIEFGTF